MSLNLSQLAKKAIAKVLIDIICADGKLTVGEVAYLEQLQNVLEISDADLEEAQYMSVTGSLSIIRDLPEEIKSAVAFIMLEMIQADGEVDEEEMKVFFIVCAAADIALPEAE